MKKSFRSIINTVITESNVILEVLDARMPNETRNIKLEKNIIRNNKKLILILNKCDLTNRPYLEKTRKELSKIAPCIFTSTKLRYGISILKKMLFRFKNPRVGVIGYPNTGKSSLINALKGKKSAKTSPIAGFTRAKQWIRIDKNILLIDTPGIIPIHEMDEIKLALINAKHPNNLKDPESVALHIIKLFLKENPLALRQRYDVALKDNALEILNEIAIKRKKLKKGGVPDLETTSRIIILEWQKNRLNLY